MYGKKYPIGMSASHISVSKKEISEINKMSVELSIYNKCEEYLPTTVDQNRQFFSHLSPSFCNNGTSSLTITTISILAESSAKSNQMAYTI